MHNAIAGISGAGKTRLAKTKLVPYWLSRRVPVLVCDPNMASDWPPVQMLTDDPYKILRLLQCSQGCVFFMEECDETIRASAKQERELKYLATRSRNDGHLGYFSSQRLRQIPPSYRNQCSTGYIFQQTPEDAEVCYSLFNQPALRDMVPTLPLGTFLKASPGKPVERYRLF